MNSPPPTQSSPTGKFFEDLFTGETFEGPPRTVGNSDIAGFIWLTQDDNPLHTDDDAARQAGFLRGRIVHGALVFGIAMGMAWQTGILVGTVLAFREIVSWKFSLPVYPGDTIQLRGRIGERKELPRLGGGLVDFEIEVVDQTSGKTVCSGTLRLLMRSRLETPATS